MVVVGVGAILGRYFSFFLVAKRERESFFSFLASELFFFPSFPLTLALTFLFSLFPFSSIHQQGTACSLRACLWCPLCVVHLFFWRAMEGKREITKTKLTDSLDLPKRSLETQVEGLARPFPEAFAKGSPGVVGLAAGILAVLFLCQRAGTAGVAAIFSPVAVVWCFALAAIGIFNLVVVPRSVALSALSAVSPHHAVRFFARNGAEGWRSLGSLALCITGAEALFADLGHFNRKSITLATCALVYPSLILT